MGGRVKDRGSLGRVLVRFVTIVIPPCRASCVVLVICLAQCAVTMSIAVSIRLSLILLLYSQGWSTHFIAAQEANKFTTN